MRRRGRGERTPLQAEINVVSLIDVMMLLMIIFMITAPMMQGGVDVELPRAAARPLNSDRALVVSVTRDGRIFADDVQLSLSEFRGTFRTLAEQSGRSGVYLRADQGVPYGRVVEVLAIMRGAGVGNIGLVAEPEDVPR
ncbi:biopolymer transporter ExbD [Pseudogemmatithrix spongiicola]|uniref:Biopolymer transporter ExbD n=1 Tax=Pseudogemmatithrix spongiicola TaxID=3062599 RepID=A0AA49JUU3_9BACT|nr:biopolymer transporter ExbD [Gemmatimonadaceae bacterium 'strain 138']WKW15427.1 biopolymer transporter ExbD [Gemmatimonadaceae bacterium 'strain 318']